MLRFPAASLTPESIAKTSRKEQGKNSTRLYLRDIWDGPVVGLLCVATVSQRGGVRRQNNGQLFQGHNEFLYLNASS